MKIICEDGSTEHKDVEVAGSSLKGTITPDQSSIRLAIRYLRCEEVVGPWWIRRYLETICELLFAGY